VKNPKILPFGDWFKVYEKAGSNFNKTQRLLESERQIAAEGGPSGNGRFVDLQIERNYQKPKVKATTTVTGTQTSAGGSQSQKATLYAYKFVVGRGASLE